MYNSGAISTHTDAATAAEMPRSTFLHRIHGIAIAQVLDYFMPFFSKSIGENC